MVLSVRSSGNAQEFWITGKGNCIKIELKDEIATGKWDQFIERFFHKRGKSGADVVSTKESDMNYTEPENESIQNVGTWSGFTLEKGTKFYQDEHLQEPLDWEHIKPLREMRKIYCNAKRLIPIKPRTVPIAPKRSARLKFVTIHVYSDKESTNYRMKVRRDSINELLTESYIDDIQRVTLKEDMVLKEHRFRLKKGTPFNDLLTRRPLTWDQFRHLGLSGQSGHVRDIYCQVDKRGFLERSLDRLCKTTTPSPNLVDTRELVVNYGDGYFKANHDFLSKLVEGEDGGLVAKFPIRVPVDGNMSNVDFNPLTIKEGTPFCRDADCRIPLRWNDLELSHVREIYCEGAENIPVRELKYMRRAYEEKRRKEERRELEKSANKLAGVVGSKI